MPLELAHHRRIRFGHKNEAFSPEQRELFQETWNTDLAALEAETERQAEALQPKDRPQRSRAGHQALPEHLARIEHRHEPESCTCWQCGKDLVKIGEDISEQLALSRYAGDGHLLIDNNPVENAIWPIAVGKKNWLLTGSERAGKRAAAIQSLLATAKLNSLDPAAWLRATLEALPTCLNSQIDSLLPLRTEPLHQLPS